MKSGTCGRIKVAARVRVAGRLAGRVAGCWVVVVALAVGGRDEGAHVGILEHRCHRALVISASHAGAGGGSRAPVSSVCVPVDAQGVVVRVDGEILVGLIVVGASRLQGKSAAQRPLGKDSFQESIKEVRS